MHDSIGPDPLLSLDPTLPRRRAVEEAIRRAVELGTLPTGARVPGARDLAADLGVSRGTVVSAVDDLVADGVLVTRARSGTFVARAPSGAVRPVHAAGDTEPRLDLRPGRPETGSFPARRWAASMRRILTTAPAPRPDPGRGDAGLRAELAAHLERVRGVRTDADRIVVCAGYRGGVSVLAVALRALGARTVAIEDPGLPGVDVPWRAAGMRVVALPVDADGADPDRIDPAADVVVVTPAHQFPLGGALSPDRRGRLVAWARRRGGFVVEDDYDGTFRFDRRSVAALQRSDPERVVLVGSVSKTLDPGLRLGWMVLPDTLVGPVARTGEALTGGHAVLDQLVLADWLRSGEYDRHVRRQRREYARRRRAVEGLLDELGVPAPGIPAGLQALVPLPIDPESAEDGIVAIGRAVTHTVQRYARGVAVDPALVVGFATPSRSAFGPALAELAGWLRRTVPDR